MRSLSGAALVLAVLLAATAARAEDKTADEPPAAPIPKIRWYTLETPHFDLHFYPEERAFA